MDTPTPAEPTRRPITHHVYTVVDREGGGRSYWTKIGTATTNRDGSLSIKLDALPVNGSLQVRDIE